MPVAAKYSYDHFTRGVSATTRRVRCLMGGPAIGDVSLARYLKWQENHLVASKMRPILTEAQNCLFADQVAPSNAAAEIAASKALATVQTLRDARAGTPRPP